MCLQTSRIIVLEIKLGNDKERKSRKAIYIQMFISQSNNGKYITRRIFAVW